MQNGKVFSDAAAAAAADDDDDDDDEILWVHHSFPPTPTCLASVIWNKLSAFVCHSLASWVSVQTSSRSGCSFITRNTLSPESRPSPKRKRSYSNHAFLGAFAVSFREGG